MLNKPPGPPMALESKTNIHRGEKERERERERKKERKRERKREKARKRVSGPRIGFWTVVPGSPDTAVYRVSEYECEYVSPISECQ